MTQKIIFIGGPSASGKTTIASRLGGLLDMSWLSADYIHDMSLAIGDKKYSPETFRIREYSAKEFYEQHSIQEVVDSEVAISHETWRGIQALIDAGYSGIIEGVAVIPELVASLENKEIDVRAVYLTNEDRAAIHKIAFERGIWAPAHMYDDEVKEKEADFALGYNDYLKNEAEKYGYPTVAVNRNDADLDKVLILLKHE